MRVRDQVQRQFGLGADGVQARRIENHQALLEQWVRQVDDRMAPARDLDRAVRVETGGQVGIVGIVQAVALRFDGRDAPRLADLAQRLVHGRRRVKIEREHGPGGRVVAVVAGGQVAGAGVDRQQAQAGRQARIPQQFGRAHGGAAGAGRQDALAVVGEEQCVDQLGFTAREFGHEGHRQAVVTQAAQRARQQLLAGRIDQPGVAQCAAVTGEGGGDPGAPGAVLL